MRGEQVVGQLLGGRAREEVVAAGLRLARRVAPAVRDPFRVRDAPHAGDQIPHPRGAFASRVGDPLRVEHPDPPLRVMQPPDRHGHVQDVALVRRRQTRPRSRQDGRDRVAQGFTRPRAGQYDRHVLPARAHRRAVHDVPAQRVARRHMRVVTVRGDQPPGHALRADAADLVHRPVVAHRRRVPVHTRPVPPAAARPHGATDRHDHAARGQRRDERRAQAYGPLRGLQPPPARQHEQQGEQFEIPSRDQRAGARERAKHEQAAAEPHEHDPAGRAHRPARIAHPIGFQFRIDHPHHLP